MLTSFQKECNEIIIKLVLKDKGSHANYIYTYTNLRLE